MNRWVRSASGMVGFGLALAAGLGGGGCVGYATYPPVAGDIARNDPNAPPMDEIMTLVLQWTSEKYPPNFGTAQAEDPDQRFAINLPVGMKPKVYAWIAEQVGPNAVPLTPETAHLPIYHIVRVRIRGNEANVDVLRPAKEYGLAPDGGPVYQGLTVYVEGGWNPWRVVRRTVWQPGTFEVPEFNYHVPEPDPNAPQPPPSSSPEEQIDPIAEPEAPPAESAPEVVPPPEPGVGVAQRGS